MMRFPRTALTGVVLTLAAGSALAAENVTIASFGRGNGGGDPVGIVADASGVLYGTTLEGGQNGGGTVWMVTP